MFLENSMNENLSSEIIIICHDIAYSRSRFYQLFNIAFRYPNKTVIEELKENFELMDEIKEFYSITPSMLEIIDVFRETVNSAIDIRELQVEYSRLFVGPFHLPAPPYESVYRAESKGRLMGDSTEEVRKMYIEEGLDISGFIHDLPDHILAELEFMSYLSEKEAVAWEEEKKEIAEQYLRKQDAFLSKHMTKWIPQFTQVMYNGSREEFYRLLAKLTSSFVTIDHDYLRAVMKSLDIWRPEDGSNPL